MNRLNLLFGPSMPPDQETLGLSFVAGPYLQPWSAIGLLSAERYVRENYDSVGIIDPFTRAFLLEDFDGFAPGDLLTIHVSSEGAGLVSDASGSLIGAFDWGTRTVAVTGGTWNFKVINNAITLDGISVSKANTWKPIIKPGIVWRFYRVPANEPQESWLTRSGLVPGDRVWLIYTVPEVTYGTKTTEETSTTFPGSDVELNEVIEVANVQAPNKIGFRGSIKVLTKIVVNGETKFTGVADTNSSETGYIVSIDNELKTITIRDVVNPDDRIYITYLSYSEYYEYSGFYDYYENQWYPYDCNPEYGHWIGDAQTDTLLNSVDALNKQTSIYLIPSAYLSVSLTFAPTGSATVADLQLEFVSAFTYGETSFVRHFVGQQTEDFDLSGAFIDASINTYSRARFGLEHYDAPDSLGTDYFSVFVPAALPIAKIVLAAPASIHALVAADIRQRGGGVPIEWEPLGAKTEPDGIDELRSYFDLGIWEGKIIKEGGVVEIHIDKTILNDWTVKEIEEIVESQMLPGIAYTILYEDNV